MTRYKHTLPNTRLPTGSASFILKRTVRECGVLPLLSATLTWTILLPLLIPDVNYWDRGIFVSVAERLLAGDLLYAQVFDNKEPFFYYFVTLQRAIAPIGEIIAEFSLLAIAAIFTYRLTLNVSSKRAAIVTAFVAVPIILTGGFYSPGCSHLPGICLCLAAYLFSSEDKVALSGIAVGILLFTKIIMVPLAISLVICAEIYNSPPHIAFKCSMVLRFCLALLFTLVLGSTVLLLRGEFFPFMNTLISNVFYAQGSLIQSTSMTTSFLSHVRRISSMHFAFALPAITIGALVTWIAKPAGNRALTGVAGTTLVALVVSLGILVTTGLWDQHNQILYIPATLLTVSLSSFLREAFYRKHGTVWVLPVVCIAILLGGVKNPRYYVGSPFEALRKFTRLNSLSPEAQRLLATGAAGSYARLGGNIDDQGHAFGLRNWTLVCPRFHQYPFESDEILGQVFSCASLAPVLVVADSLVASEGWTAWNHFVSNVEELLKSSYSCDAVKGLRICRRRA